MKFAILAAAITLSGAWSTAQEGDRESRIQWLKEHAVPLAADSDGLEDLAPVARALGQSRVLLLGEATHGDGTTFEIKTRLVRYLHQNAGFSGLAFESELFSCRKAWHLMKEGGDPVAVASAGVASIWTDSRQMRPLFEYLAGTAGSGDPLELAGFDMQIGQAARDHLVADLSAFLARDAASLAESESWETVRGALEAMLGGETGPRDFDEERAASFLEALKTMADQLASPASSDAASDRAFWRQELESLQATFRFMRTFDPQNMRKNVEDGVFDVRNTQMARNALFLADEYFAPRKLILWGNIGHFIRNRSSIQPAGPAMVPMGQPLWEKWGRESYVLGFVTYEGETGMALEGPGGQTRPIPAPSEGSLEDLAAAAGLNIAFIDLRGAGGVSWLRQELTARPLGHREMQADWGQSLDGLIFVRQSERSQRAEDDEK